MSTLLLSHQRCGSSALTRFLRQGCGIRAAIEPFNGPSLKKRLPHWQSASREEIDAHVRDTLTSLELAKHIYGGQSPLFDAQLIAHPRVTRLVLLWRENAEAAALSTAIARATGHFNKRAEGPLPAIEVSDVRRRAARMRQARETVHACVVASDKPAFLVSYEQLFEPSARYRFERVQQLLRFLGLQERPETEHAFDEHLAPERKLNSADTYAQIANMEQLREAFPHIFDRPGH